MHDRTDRLAFVHQIEGIVDPVQIHGVGDERRQFDVALHRVLHHARQLAATLDATEGRAHPLAAGDQLEGTGGDFLAGAGQEISTRPFQLVTGRKWMGTAFGGVKGRSQLPGMVEDAMKGDIELAPFVTHTMDLDGINDAFDLMHEGKSIRSVVHY